MIAPHQTLDPVKVVEPPPLARIAAEFMRESIKQRYSYAFSWLARPIIQYPQDMVALQEIVWRVRPTLIIETGIAHGGSVVLSASLLALLDYCEAASNGGVLDPKASRRRVLAVDIDIRQHNRTAIEAHPLAHMIRMIQGSSVASDVVTQVHEAASGHERILVLLDSNHTHAHVLAELYAYAPLVTPGSYCVVFDTIVEYLPKALSGDRPWGPGDNPATAVALYLAHLRSPGCLARDGSPLHLEVDQAIDQRLAVSVAPGGYLWRPDRDRSNGDPA
jgi:cephalosporin hydroxylase